MEYFYEDYIYQLNHVIQSHIRRYFNEVMCSRIARPVTKSMDINNTTINDVSKLVCYSFKIVNAILIFINKISVNYTRQ